MTSYLIAAERLMWCQNKGLRLHLCLYFYFLFPQIFKEQNSYSHVIFLLKYDKSRKETLNPQSKKYRENYFYVDCMFFHKLQMVIPKCFVLGCMSFSV